VLLFAIQAPLLAEGLRPHFHRDGFVGFCEYVRGRLRRRRDLGREIEDEVPTSTAFNVLLSAGIARRFHHGPATLRLVGDPELTRLLRYMSVLPAISAFAAAPTAPPTRHGFRPLALRPWAVFSRAEFLGLI